MSESSAHLVLEAMKGDRIVYGLLVKKYAGLVYAMAFRMTGDHHLAEDLCQDVFTKVWMKLHKLKDPEAFPGWLATMARRSCLNAIDHRCRKKEVADDQAMPPAVSPEMPASFDSTRIILEEAIAQLSLQDRQLITLSYFEELSSTQVAGIMELEPGTVRVYLTRAREKLRKMLEGRKDELFES